MHRINGATQKILVFSHHLEMRGQQRGISSDTIDLIARFGKKTRVKGGKFQRMIRQSDAKRLIEYGISTPSDIERTKGIKLITKEEDPNGKIMMVTVHQYSRNSGHAYTGHFYRTRNRHKFSNLWTRRIA